MCECDSCVEKTNTTKIPTNKLLTKSELAVIETILGQKERELLNMGKWNGDKYSNAIHIISWKLPHLTGNSP